MNTKMFKYSGLIISSVIVSLTFSGCGAAAHLQSSWNNNEIKIDGDPTEWQSNAFIVKDEKVSLNFKNDNEFLSLCLITNDRGKIMQMIRSGFVVWFSSDKNESKTFGIKYPMQASLIDKDERREFNLEIFQPDDMQNNFKKMIVEANEFQILNEEKFPLSQYPVENNEGIKVKLGYNADRFIYELQIPIGMQNKFQHKLAALPGENVKIKFETLEYEFDGMPAGGMMPRGNREGAFESQVPSGRMKKGEGKQFTKPEPFDFIVELQLQKQE